MLQQNSFNYHIENIIYFFKTSLGQDIIENGNMPKKKKKSNKGAHKRGLQKFFVTFEFDLDLLLL